jgi:hypothetical protein
VIIEKLPSNDKGMQIQTVWWWWEIGMATASKFNEKGDAQTVR